MPAIKKNTLCQPNQIVRCPPIIGPMMGIIAKITNRFAKSLAPSLTLKRSRTIERMTIIVAATAKPWIKRKL